MKILCTNWWKCGVICQNSININSMWLPVNCGGFSGLLSHAGKGHVV